MIKMLLVEDENYERKFLSECIDWALIGVEIVGEATNGSQGLNKTLELRPDIVLTDVRMPVMSGIEMSQKIRQIAPSVRIIFLSSYDEFEYAKQAIDLSVSAYLMKPVNEIDLLRTIRKIADEINDERLERILASRNMKNLSTSIGLARQALVTRALAGIPIDDIDARNLGLDWILTTNQLLFAVSCLYIPKDLSTFVTAIDQLGQKMQKTVPKSILVFTNAGHLVALGATNDDEYEEMSSQARKTLRTFFAENAVDDVRLELSKSREISELGIFLRKRLQQPIISISSTEKGKKCKEQIIQDMKLFIESHYDNSLTLESIAREMHFTPNYLGTIFREVTKTSVNHHILEIRLNAARELLKTSKQSMGEIALRCGFGSSTYFHTIFKKEIGITPSMYRLNNVIKGS